MLAIHEGVEDLVIESDPPGLKTTRWLEAPDAKLSDKTQSSPSKGHPKAGKGGRVLRARVRLRRLVGTEGFAQAVGLRLWLLKVRSS